MLNKKAVIIISFIILIVGSFLVWKYRMLKIPFEKSQKVTTTNEFLKEKYKEEERFSPPKGFLIPGPNSVPEQFQLQETYFTDNVSHYRYRNSDDSSMLYIIENRYDDYESIVNSEISGTYYNDKEEVNYLGSHGVILSHYIEDVMNNFTYDLYERVLMLNREGHLFKILTRGGEFSTSNNNILNLLKTLQPAP